MAHVVSRLGSMSTSWSPTTYEGGRNPNQWPVGLVGLDVLNRLSTPQRNLSARAKRIGFECCLPSRWQPCIQPRGIQLRLITTNQYSDRG